MVPFKRLQELFNDVFQIPLSQGTFDGILNRGQSSWLISISKLSRWYQIANWHTSMRVVCE